MPAIEETDLIHFAVLWVPTGRTENNEPTVADPVEIQCRWVNKRTSTVRPDGTTIGLDATVVVDREIPADSLMWKGRLREWDDALKGSIMRVEWYAESDDLRGVFTGRKVGLTRYKADLPGVETG